jgi:signal transduction histidine kinase
MDAFMAAISFIGDRARVAAARLRVVVREDDSKSSCRTMRSPTCGSTVRAVNVKSLWARVRPYAFDVVVVLGAIGGLVEMALTRGKEDSAAGPLWALWLAVLVTTVPLLARRRLPFAAPAAVFIGGGAVSFLEGRAVPYSFFTFLAVLSSAFLFAMLNERRLALAGLPLIYATVAVVTRNDPDPARGDFVFISLLLTASWFAGLTLNRKFAQAAEAQERARRLEAERAALIGDERRRIARELHDVVAHSVSVMTVQAGGVRRLLRDDQRREREALLAVENTGREALTEMRRLLGMLRDTEETPSLAPQPGVESIGALVQAVRDAGLSVEYRVKGDPVPLPPGIDVSAYRIVQEALTNTLKHAGPVRAEVTVRYGGDQLELEVVNDGSTDADGSPAGHGLVGMEERVALYGGKLEAAPRREGGYVVRAELPVREPQR